MTFERFNIGDWTVTDRRPVYSIGYFADWLFYIFISVNPPGPSWKFTLENRRSGEIRTMILANDQGRETIAATLAFVEASPRG